MGHYYISDAKYENKIKTLIGNKGISVQCRGKKSLL